MVKCVFIHLFIYVVYISDNYIAQPLIHGAD